MHRLTGLLKDHPVRLSKTAIHLWQLPLLQATAENLFLWPLLSVDEQERAKRFVRRQDQEKFVRARGFVRLLLGHYLSLPPAEVVFEYGLRGKPQLAVATRATGLQFNLSHCQDLAIVAIAPRYSLGVDLEQLNPQVSYLDISGRFFASAEDEFLRRLPE
ncbi:MAG: 4'-phosphopantetheinyl transferase, partial [Acaryochloridaceae cyanobacterium SU_2_1]|nr:4'-phosphopantetheinyl transferase [Acaryochloridaceae cyanobacterium SU_2_1]